MITGSNGVGKTAVARVLSGLWAPGNEGKVHRPGRGDVFVVPQRAYMVTGSLLDQYVSHASEQLFYLKADWWFGIKNNLSAYVPAVCTVRANERRTNGDPQGRTFGVHTRKRGWLGDSERMERCIEWWREAAGK